MVNNRPIWFAFSPKKEYFYDYEVVSFSLSWSFVAVLTDETAVRVLSRSKLKQLKQLSQFNTAAKIQATSGVEMVQYPNQLTIFHVEKKDSSSYLVVNEFLFKYDSEMNTEDYKWSVPNKIADVKEPLHAITSIMGGQAIAWYEKPNLSIVKVCSYSEYFDRS